VPNGRTITAHVPLLSSVEAGTEIATAFDPMMAKLIAHAPTRREAALRLAAGLARLVAPGVVTNRDFLVNVLRHPAFLAGDTTTDFIERHRPDPVRVPSVDELREAALAAALADQIACRHEARVLRTMASGWRNNPSAFQERRFRGGGRELAIGYLRQRDGTFQCRLDGQAVSATVVRALLPVLELEIDGRGRAFRVVRGPRGVVYVLDAQGELRLDELPRFPEPESAHGVVGGYTAPMPGKVVDIRVAVGDPVTRGQTVVTIEAMKMEHHLVAASDGMVTEIRVSPGQQVDAGQVLVTIEASERG
jgi:propionyl-CoA carboxylase alpha chain